MLTAGSIVLDDFKPPRGQVQNAPSRPRGVLIEFWVKNRLNYGFCWRNQCANRCANGSSPPTYFPVRTIKASGHTVTHTILPMEL
jgi:hypothetical protein